MEDGQSMITIVWLICITANWLEARTIKYINFPAKYLNFIEIYMKFYVRSASRETIAGVLVFQSCSIMRNIIAHSILVQSEFR